VKALFSSIAWAPEQAVQVASVLRKAGIKGIEAAPGLFDRPLSEVDVIQCKAVRTFWEQEQLPIRAMQALLFGMPHLRLFGSSAEREELANYLLHVIRVAGALGAVPLVFGSPRNRARNGLAEDEAFSLAVDFFAKLAPHAAEGGCVLCIEANTPAYHCDFITTHAEAARLVAAVNSAGFGVHLDTGVMQMNGESPAQVLDVLNTYHLAPQHIHISQPFLDVVHADTSFHVQLHTLLKVYGYAGAVSVEMKKPDHFSAIATAAQTVAHTYGAYDVVSC